jgi:hypothetical protein
LADDRLADTGFPAELRLAFCFAGFGMRS